MSDINDRDSILVSVKKIIGIHKNDDNFDHDIIDDTNGVLANLAQFGIGDPNFELVDASQTWHDFLLDHQVNLRQVKIWVGQNVRLIFDPPTSQTHLQSIKEIIKEAEWRMYITENYTDEDFERVYYGKKSVSDAGIVNGSLEMIAPYLYQIEYSDLDYDFANKYFNAKNLGIKIGAPGCCSSVRNGQWCARNFDWVYSNQAEFIVKTSNTIGIAGQIPELTDDFVKTNEYSDLYKIVPFMIVDGINKDGLFCTTNVVPTDKGSTTGTVPATELKNKISSVMLPRYILDNFSSAKGAVLYLQNFVSVYVPKNLQKMGYETHYLIADKNNTYLIEFIDNELRALEISSKPYMTNFHLLGTTFNPDGKVYTPADVELGHLPSVENGITPHGSGLERYNLIVQNYDNCGSKEGMLDLMNKLFYTNAYKNSTNPYWYTEFVGNRNLTVDSSPEEYQEVVDIVQEAYRNRKRVGADIDTWQTNHTSIYDLKKRCLFLRTQEHDEEYIVTLD